MSVETSWVIYSLMFPSQGPSMVLRTQQTRGILQNQGMRTE